MLLLSCVVVVVLWYAVDVWCDCVGVRCVAALLSHCDVALRFCVFVASLLCCVVCLLSCCCVVVLLCRRVAVLLPCWFDVVVFCCVVVLLCC